MKPRCGKVCHRSRNGALIAWRRTGKDAALQAYFCRRCKAWHLGTNGDLMPNRIDQLLKRAQARDEATTKGYDHA